MSEEDITYLAPPWIKYPTYPKNASFWKTGSGAEYLIQFNQTIEDKKEYYKIFPIAPSFMDELEPSQNLSQEAINYLNSTEKPIFIKLWTEDSKPGITFEKSVEEPYIYMFDTILIDDSKHIHIGSKSYSSTEEIIQLAKEEIICKSQELWDELKYTVYLNALYYRIVADINFTKQLMKTKDHGIVFKSDNLEWGVEEKEKGVFLGKNLMGIAMMEIRDVLNKVYAHYEDIDWNISGEKYSSETCACHLHNHSPK